MKNHEMERLRALLTKEADAYAQREHITDAAVRLSEDNGYGMTTKAEILVFGLERSALPRLQVAYMAYEELIDICFPSRFDEETSALIAKARAIAPPIRSFDRDIPFETGMSDEQSFRWFAKTFLNLPFRQAAAIYAKHRWNNMHLVRFADE